MLRSGHINMANNSEEITMQKTSTRRTFIQIFPLAGIMTRLLSTHTHIQPTKSSWMRTKPKRWMKF